MYLKEFNKNHIRDFRLTEEGYFKLKEESSYILEVIYSLTSDLNLSYNEIIIKSYDFLEQVFPGFFNFFCNLYYLGEVIDGRTYPITQEEKDRWMNKLKLIEKQTNIYRMHFYNKQIEPVLYVKSQLNNDYFSPIDINCILVMMNFILEIINTPYKDLFIPKGSFARDLLNFKRGVLF